VKSFVNAVAEIVGVLAAAELVVELAVELAAALDVVLDDEDELPHAAIPRPAATASTAMRALLFSKCTIISSFLSDHAKLGRGAGPAVSTVMNRGQPRTADVNEPLTSACPALTCEKSRLRR
jgi:hypothetical protein